MAEPQELAPPQTNSLTSSEEISQLDYRLAATRTDVVFIGLNRLAAACRQQLMLSVLELIWGEVLAPIAKEDLERYFRKLEETFVPTQACPFPMPAHILSMWTEEQTMRKNQAAEEAWQHALKTIVEYWSPQFGWKRWTPNLQEINKRKTPFDLKTEVATGAAGGTPYLYNADGDRLVWAKKDFIAAYTRES